MQSRFAPRSSMHIPEASSIATSNRPISCSTPTVRFASPTSAWPGCSKVPMLHAAEVEGTGPFMAPEQISRSWGHIDTQTDVYGLGAVLFTLLTGRPPWPGRRLNEILADVTSATPVIAPAQLRAEIPESLSAICQRCLSKTPEHRYASIEDVRSALSQLKLEG